MVTAYSEYALDAFRLFVSGYVLKPFSDDDLRAVLNNLRTPVTSAQNKLLEIICFGNFEVLTDGKPMKFKRSKVLLQPIIRFAHRYLKKPFPLKRLIQISDKFFRH